MKHLNLIVTGKVQGVSYRAATKAVADQLGIRGFVVNRHDGSVYIEAEGKPFSIDMFLDWCKEGPEKAVVENVEHEESELRNFQYFEIRKK